MNATLAPQLSTLNPVGVRRLVAETPVDTADAQERPTSVTGRRVTLSSTNNDQGVEVADTACRPNTPCGSLL